MCKHGTHVYVDIINKEQNRTEVPVDACIADEIRELNNLGIITLGCCCGHGVAGEIKTIDNGGIYKWRERVAPPHTLIKKESVQSARELDYLPFPYRYLKDDYDGVWQIQLKTGCITEDDVEVWHKM